MLLDTGTAPSVIDLQTARKVKLKLRFAGYGGSGGGTESNAVYTTTLRSVRLNGFRASDVTCLAMDMSEVSKKFGRPIHGALGDSLLSGRVVQFDYPHHLVRFLRDSPFAERSAKASSAHVTVTLPFSHDDCVRLTGVCLDGHKISANLDTGSNTAFCVTPTVVKRLGLTNEELTATAHTETGFNGSYASRDGQVGSIAFGSILIKSPHVTFWQKGTGHDNEPWDINVGNPFLKNYIVTFDYKTDKVTFEDAGH